MYHSYGHCPCSSSGQIVLNCYIILRKVSLLFMAIFKLRLLLLLPDYCPSFSAISLCCVNTNHSQNNGHSLTSTIATSRLNHKVPRPLGGWYVYFNAQGYCPKSHQATFMVIHHTTNNLHIRDNYTSQTVYSICQISK
jgi:hypothetical protein